MSRLTEDDLFEIDAQDIPEPLKLKIGALLAEVREYRALAPFAAERASYPMATWGEKKLSELVLRISA